MNVRISFIVLALFAFASASAREPETADAARKPVPAPATRLALKPAVATTDKNSAEPAQPQSQSLRASNKKTGGGQTEDDLYVGVK